MLPNFASLSLTRPRASAPQSAKVQGSGSQEVGWVQSRGVENGRPHPTVLAGASAHPVMIALFVAVAAATGPSPQISLDVGVGMWLVSELLRTQSALYLNQAGQFVFPPRVRRVWIVSGPRLEQSTPRPSTTTKPASKTTCPRPRRSRLRVAFLQDVGVNAETQMMPQLNADVGLFVVGLEPARKWTKTPCAHARCTTLWAAATPTLQLASLIEQDWDQCSSLLPGLAPKAATGAQRVRCLRNRSAGARATVPGVPLAQIVARLPPKVTLEYVKVDAQGYDLEVMRGLLPASAPGLLVSLETQDVEDRSMLLYNGQPTLTEVRAFLSPHGWHYVGHDVNEFKLREVDAFFVYYASSSSAAAAAKLAMAKQIVAELAPCTAAELKLPTVNGTSCLTWKHLQLAQRLVLNARQGGRTVRRRRERIE